jgi:hypothetical protein
MQKIVAVWLWFEANTGMAPNKAELKILLKINKLSNREFEKVFRLVIYRVLGSTKAKNYYIDSVPDICFNIGSELKEANNFYLETDAKVEHKKKKERFVVLSR